MKFTWIWNVFDFGEYMNEIEHGGMSGKVIECPWESFHACITLTNCNIDWVLLFFFNFIIDYVKVLVVVMVVVVVDGIFFLLYLAYAGGGVVVVEHC